MNNAHKYQKFKYTREYNEKNKVCVQSISISDTAVGGAYAFVVNDVEADHGVRTLDEQGGFGECKSGGKEGAQSGTEGMSSHGHTCWPCPGGPAA